MVCDGRKIGFNKEATKKQKKKGKITKDYTGFQARPSFPYEAVCLAYFNRATSVRYRAAKKHEDYKGLHRIISNEQTILSLQSVVGCSFYKNINNKKSMGRTCRFSN